MPSTTFFNLPKEKKEKIIHSAVQEFSRVEFGSASIQNIIKKAEIPRGSFYQYFENKEDLYLYLLEDIGKNHRKSFQNYLVENNGDLFLVLEKIFISEFKDHDSVKYHKLYKNFFKHSKMDQAEKVRLVKYLKPSLDEKKKIHNAIKLDTLKDSDPATIDIIISSLFAIMHQHFTYAMRNELSVDEALNRYKKVIEIYKYGILK